MALNETLVQSPNEESSKEILKFLKEGEDKIEIGKFKDVTLAMGFTGSGKSTLTQFLTGNDEGLTAEETGEDTGEFTILDKNHNVCRGTIDSCTIIPTLYIDKESKSAFYDCPGFGDTRSAKHDISVTYFIKKVIDSVDSVKLLLTVNHHSLREGVDRQNFMLLVKNVLNMVKNIDKFKDGIALVVTKVDNAYKLNKKTKMATLVPDKAVISNIAQFLGNAKETLKTKQVAQQDKNEDHSYYTDAIKFINILLEKDGDDYIRIGLFRRPDEEGPLSGSTLLQSGKSRMQKILQSIQYIPKTPQDFGYTVSAESLNQMHDLIQQVNEKLSMTFESMGRSIQDHYSLQESKAKDAEELYDELSVGHNALYNIKDNGNYKSPILLSNAIEKFAQNENITISAESVADVVHYDHFLGFIHEISGLSTSSKEWLNGLKEAAENVRIKRNWAYMLFQLQTRLSDYAVLNEIRTNPGPANDLKECIDSMEHFESESGHCDGLENFLTQTLNMKEEYANYYNGEVKPNVYEWKLLKGLLDFKMESSCSEDFGGSMLTLKGQYVKLSDINVMNCRWSAKSVKIFALKKVFIDQSYDRIGDMAEVVIIAPNWEVIGSPSIALDGADGDDQKPRKAGDGPSPGRSGYHGGSGGNGGEGGMFWGMGQNCVNCQYLSVSANGGQGGAGQDGGDGANGRDFYSQYEGDQHGKLITVFYNKVITDIIHHGERGGDGGNGGNGGSGGEKGMVKFILYRDGSKPTTSSAQGIPGTGGAGGVPGKGGRSERRVHRVQTILIVPWWGNDDPITLPSADDGSWGQNGKSGDSVRVFSLARFPNYSIFHNSINSIPLNLPTAATGKFSNPSETLNYYIKLLQVKINTSLTDATTREFLVNLENADINDLKHHIGRRSVVHPTATATNNITTKRPSFIKRALSFISTRMNPHKLGSLSIDTEETTNYNKLTSFQGIGTVHFKIPHKIQQITNSNSEAVATRDGFGVSHAQSNLLLLDYLYRMSNRPRRERKKNRSYSDRHDSHYAQRMAYTAYIS